MSDLIDRQAAIASFRYDDDGTAWDMDDIVFRLEQFPSAQPEPCEDAVSRQAVYTVIEEVLYETTKGADNWYGLLNDGVRTLLPVQASPCEFCKHNDIADETVCLRCPAERRTDDLQ